MTSISKETWEVLPVPVGEKLIARPALPEVTNRLLCAIDANNIRHYLINLGLSGENYSDKKSRGVCVVTRSLTLNRNSPERYLDIVCLESNNYEVFNLIGGEIANSLTDLSIHPIEIVKTVFSKWRRFWGQLPQPLLSYEEQLGLFGELWFLHKWLIPIFGEKDVMAWCGPWGNHHDFEWINRSVEVKTTTSNRGRIHHVNDLSQLENDESKPLYLFSICLRRENGAQNNLPKLIETCRICLLDSEDYLSHFEEALVRVGYSPINEDEYSKLEIHVVEDILFEVTNDFPKITKENFINGLPLGIEKIVYEINLNPFDHLIVAQEPCKLPFGKE